MRNRTTPTAGSPRIRTPMGGPAYKDKPGVGGSNMDPKNLAILALLLVVGFMAFQGSSNKSAPAVPPPVVPAATQNPNAVRGLQQQQEQIQQLQQQLQQAQQQAQQAAGGAAAVVPEVPAVPVPDVALNDKIGKQSLDAAAVAAVAAQQAAQLAQQAAEAQKAKDEAAEKERIAAEARRAAKEHHDQDAIAIQQAHEKALEQKGVKGANAGGVGGIKGAKNNKKEKLKVKDADGDWVMDDMLAKDIAAGHDVDAGHHQEEEEKDIDIGETRWKNSRTIPKWMKDYFNWHKKTTTLMTKDNWRNYRYLVMTCLGGEICGNVAHRLRPIMAMIRVAADSKRVFYIHWDLPDRLEKFIHPPQHGGIDWIVPEFVMWKVRRSPHQTDMKIIDQQAYQDDRRVVNCMYNDDTFGEPYYNERRKDGEKAASEAFHDVWNVLFKPSFMLTERIGESLRLMGLKPGEYATAHIDYEMVPKDDAEQEELRLKVENAMNCMSTLRPGGPFLVAAQTYAIAREAIVYGKAHNVKVHAKQIAHDTSTVPTDLFTSFVEIMLMADTRCVAYNRGGYGQLGYILGYDYNCRIEYGAPHTECKWKDPPAATQERAKLVRRH